MALQSPPPYFPQGIQEPNPNRYRKFKLIITSLIISLILVLIGAGFGIYYLVKYLAA